MKTMLVTAACAALLVTGCATARQGLASAQEAAGAAPALVQDATTLYDHLDALYQRVVTLWRPDTNAVAAVK